MRKIALVTGASGGVGRNAAERRMELVPERAINEIADKATIAKFYQETYERVKMIRVSGANVLLSPPLIITSQEISSMLNAMDDAFSALRN